MKQKTISDMTEDELSMFIYEQGFCGSPLYWNNPVITFRDVDKEVLFFEYRQRQKPSIGELEIFTTGLLELGEDPRLFTEKHGTSFFRLKHINKLLKMGYYLPVYGLTH